MTAPTNGQAPEGQRPPLISKVGGLVEDLLGLVMAAFCWRVLVSAGLAAAFAVLLVNAVDPFSGVQAIAVVLVGTFAGFAWHEKAHGVPLIAPSATARRTSTPVAALAFACGGSVWGLLSSTSAAAALLGAALLAAIAAGVHVMYTRVLKRRVAAGHALLYFCCSVIGFAVTIAVVRLNA